MNRPIAAAQVAEGRYSLTAQAIDDAGAATTSSPVTVRVNAAPAIFLGGPLNDATFTAPATTGVSATAGDGDGTIAKVEFLRAMHGVEFFATKKRRAPAGLLKQSLTQSLL